MGIEIKNPTEDQYGNDKNNIFIAFDNSAEYLGSAYIYPNFNQHQIDEIDCLIFISINIGKNVDDLLKSRVKQNLFDKAFMRAREIRNKNPELTTRIYSGFEYNDDNMNFYIKNGFQKDYSIIMEATISEDFKYKLPEEIQIMELDVTVDKNLDEYKKIYDEIFISPLDIELLLEQSKKKNFKCLYFLKNKKIMGSCTIFESNGLGYVETLYVLPEQRGKGISRIIINYILNYFSENGLTKTKLEVWELNKIAVRLYQSLGYREVSKNLMFPGVDI